MERRTESSKKWRQVCLLILVIVFLLYVWLLIQSGNQPMEAQHGLDTLSAMLQSLATTLLGVVAFLVSFFAIAIVRAAEYSPHRELRDFARDKYLIGYFFLLALIVLSLQFCSIYIDKSILIYSGTITLISVLATLIIVFLSYERVTFLMSWRYDVMPRGRTLEKLCSIEEFAVALKKTANLEHGRICMERHLAPERVFREIMDFACHATESNQSQTALLITSEYNAHFSNLIHYFLLCTLTCDSGESEFSSKSSNSFIRKESEMLAVKNIKSIPNPKLPSESSSIVSLPVGLVASSLLRNSINRLLVLESQLLRTQNTDFRRRVALRLARWRTESALQLEGFLEDTGIIRRLELDKLSFRCCDNIRDGVRIALKECDSESMDWNYLQEKLNSLSVKYIRNAKYRHYSLISECNEKVREAGLSGLILGTSELQATLESIRSYRRLLLTIRSSWTQDDDLKERKRKTLIVLFGELGQLLFELSRMLGNEGKVVVDRAANDLVTESVLLAKELRKMAVRVTMIVRPTEDELIEFHIKCSNVYSSLNTIELSGRVSSGVLSRENIVFRNCVLRDVGWFRRSMLVGSWRLDLEASSCYNFLN